MQCPKAHLHVKLPEPLSKLLEEEGQSTLGMNKSLLIISILAERYGVLADEWKAMYTVFAASQVQIITYRGRANLGRIKWQLKTQAG